MVGRPNTEAERPGHDRLSEFRRGEYPHEEPRRAQESERPYELGSGVTPAEQRDAGRWIREEQTDGTQPGGSAHRGASAYG